MGTEEIINQILADRSDLDRKQVLAMIQKKKSEVPNFLTDETAARLTASELGVKTANKTHRFKIQIKDIFSGLNDVTVSGKVVSVYPPKTFKRKDWTEGKLASIIVTDQTGRLRVVLWDNKVDWVEQGRIQKDQTLRISHGYVRQGLDGKPEIHLGDKGRIKILDEQTKKLGDITKEGGPITVEGRISTAPQFREVTTAKNEKVCVASFQLSDSTAKINVSVWRKLAKTVKELAVGTQIKMKNVYAKKGYQNSIELSSRYVTTIDILE